MGKGVRKKKKVSFLREKFGCVGVVTALLEATLPKPPVAYTSCVMIL